MTNNLSERVITAAWLGILGYLVVPFLVFSFTLTGAQIIISGLTCLSAILYGYFYGFKIFLQPADQLNFIIIRITAAVWCGCLGFSIAELILSIFTTETYQVTMTKMLVPMLFAIIFIVSGIVYGYRLLLLPDVTYIKLFPEIKQRMLCMILFGLMGSVIQVLFFHGFANPNSVFVIALVAYLGFFYGCRILLLPGSWRGALKAMMLGFIGSSYVSLITIVMFFLAMLFIPSLPGISQSPVINPVVDAITASLFIGFSLFIVVALFACVPVVIFSLLLYLMSIVFRRA